MQNNLPRLQFAPATQNGGTEEFDLNEIFAEYFINEFDDPMNAYTSSMANYGANVASTTAAAIVKSAAEVSASTTGADVAAGAPDTNCLATSAAARLDTAIPAKKNLSQSAGLPTGGIRTIFHAEVKKESAAAQAPLQVGLAAGGIPAPVGISPIFKKVKTDLPSTSSTAGAAQVQGALPDPSPLQSLAAGAPATPVPAAQPTQGVVLHPGMLLSQQQIASLLPHMQAAAAAAGPGSSLVAGETTADGGGARLALPVGVGIRLGGVGGIAPATAQSAARAPGIPAMAIWGGAQLVGAPTEQAVQERRQRNREHAKRSRVRKKFMLESLQEKVRELQKENQELRMMVQKHIPEHAMKIISECCSDNVLFADPDENPDAQAQELVRADMSLMQSLAAGQKCFVLSDPKLPDNPIVFASGGFYELTGYTSKEVLGRNCRFLQGPGTDPKAVDVIRKAVASGSDATVCLLNYKADGTPFWNQFFIAALRDADNCIVNYVGVQTEVQPETAVSALEDRVNAVMPLQNKDKDDDFDAENDL